MTDHVNKSKRSEIMRSVKGRNTGPEIIVRRYLFSKGFRYQVHVKKLAGTPDIVLKKFAAVVFVHGCFWHGHTGCKKSSLPKSRTEWWRLKIDRNKENDKKNRFLLENAGWRVFDVWQCDLTARREETLVELVAIIQL